MNWLKSKRFWTTVLTVIAVPISVSKGYLTEEVALGVVATIIALIFGDTMRPSGSPTT